MSGFKIFLVVCALVLGGAAVTAVFHAMKKNEEKTIATIPEEFKYVYVNVVKFVFINFVAIDLRNKKMLLELDGKRKIYDFSDIKGHKRDTREVEVSHTAFKSSGRIKRGTNSHTLYDLTLHVNDPGNPTWQFSSGIKDEIDCAQLLLSRAFDGTLPDTEERKVLSFKNAEKFRSLLPAYTGAQE